jgi:hypothetical protein
MGERKNADRAASDSVEPRSRARRALASGWRGLRILALIYLGILVLLMIFEEHLIFFPSRYPEGDWNPAGLEFDAAEFVAADGVRLHGWFCPVPEPRAVVLVSHGNAGNITHRAEEILLWQRHLHVAVFIYDYRGYGRSEGSPNEAGVYADVQAAYRYLLEERAVAPQQIVLRGESIGSAVSLELGLHQPHRALIMESPFSSLMDMGSHLYPWFPARWLVRNRFDSASKITQYRRPLLITHGTRDSIIPFRMGQQLYELANEPKHFSPVPGADHNDVPWVGGAAYFQAIDRFLDAALQTPLADQGPTLD